jgi:hypothetical protein
VEADAKREQADIDREVAETEGRPDYQ